MPPSPSPDLRLSSADKELLLDIAEGAIATALSGGRFALPKLAELPKSLHQRIGAFVTLTVAGQLNGCIGTVEPREPIGHAVARLALAAAFDDPRLPALRPSDLAELTIEVSLLSPLTPIDVSSFTELRDALRPDHEGLVIRSGGRDALFLPTVWRQLPDRDDFLDHLWRKAGLRPGTWTPAMQALRFTSEHFERNIRQHRPARSVKVSASR